MFDDQINEIKSHATHLKSDGRQMLRRGLRNNASHTTATCIYLNI
jgi:hypothetical protein